MFPINIDPGENTQLQHLDDGFYPAPRARKALSAATIWACTRIDY